MLSKKEIKDIQSLAHKKNRDEANLFLAEGPKIVEEIIRSAPQQVVQLLAVPGWIDAHEKQLPPIPVTTISDTDLQRISGLQTPHHVLAIVKKFDDFLPDARAEFCLYLDTLQDPGNMGTIIRTADWFGIKSIVCSPGCADRYNPKVVQSSMASIMRINVFEEVEQNWLQAQQGIPVLAATLDGGSIYGHQPLQAGVLLIGNESQGLSQNVLRYATEKITIPQKGGAESLNAAVATGIILSHLAG